MTDRDQGEPQDQKPMNQNAEFIDNAVRSNDVPHIYFNGFVNSISTGDVLLVLKSNERPVAVLNASYTLAKTLVEKLGELVTALETRTDNTIMTTDDVARALAKEIPGANDGGSHGTE